MLQKLITENTNTNTHFLYYFGGIKGKQKQVGMQWCCKTWFLQMWMLRKCIDAFLLQNGMEVRTSVVDSTGDHVPYKRSMAINCHFFVLRVCSFVTVASWGEDWIFVLGTLWPRHERHRVGGCTFGSICRRVCTSQTGHVLQGCCWWEPA